MSDAILKNDWQAILQEQFDSPYYEQLQIFLEGEYATQKVFPAQENIWTAFQLTAYEDVKVVILGQDPYHGEHQAHGMSFSVKKGIAQPPSLKNILKELQTDLGYDLPVHGELTKWAKQGVLLLNTVLTVRAHQAHSHKNQGWEIFTDAVIQNLVQREKPIIFVLWGKPAQQKKKFIDTSKHYVIEAPHPSPLSAYRGFFGSKPFSKINAYLQEIGEKPIDFNLTKLDE